MLNCTLSAKTFPTLTTPTITTTLTSLMLSTAPNSIASGLKLPLSTNHINYTNPWKTDHFTSTWPKPPLSPNIHHKAADSVWLWNKNKRSCRGKKYSEKYNVFLYSAVAFLFSFSSYKTWCYLVRSFSDSTAKRALSWQKHVKQIAHYWH